MMAEGRASQGSRIYGTTNSRMRGPEQENPAIEELICLIFQQNNSQSFAGLVIFVIFVGRML